MKTTTTNTSFATLQQDLFSAGSRYHGIDHTTRTMPDGSTVVYLRRRFVPPPERLEDLTKHTISDGDRLDLLAARYYGDSLLFWRICDANVAIRPSDLLRNPGGTLRITMPEGMPGGRQ